MGLAVGLEAVLDVAQLVGDHYEAVEDESLGLHCTAVLVLDNAAVVVVQQRVDNVDAAGRNLVRIGYVDDFLALLGEFDGEGPRRAALRVCGG